NGHLYLRRLSPPHDTLTGRAPPLVVREGSRFRSPPTRTTRRRRYRADPDMLSRFYKRFSGLILWVVGLSFPYLTFEAHSLPSNNDIETWLPRESIVRATYERFKRDFGVEESILIGVERKVAGDALIEAACGRIERLPGVRRCMSPQRLEALM